MTDEPIDLPEAQRLRTGAALIDPGPWEVLAARGNDRVGFLHRVLTGKIEGTPPGQGGRTMLLTPKGHIVSDLLFFVGPEEVRLVVPPGEAGATASALGRYAIMDDFVAQPLPELRLLGIHGAGADACLRQAGVAVPEGFAAGPRFSHLEIATAEGAAWLVRVQGYGAPGLWLFAPAEGLAGVRARLEQAGVAVIDPETAERLRIVSGEPKVGAEITADYFPMEVGRGAAIDYGKGCFLGQEPIVRIRDRGHINWRLVGLRFSAPAAVAAGDRLESEVKPKAGRLTSVGRLPDGRPVALALLHVSVPVGAAVRVLHGEEAPVPAEVRAVPEDS
jgi:folate-binding protein YgfZ